MQTEQLLCWSGMTDTEHSTTSGLNEEDCYVVKISQLIFVAEIISCTKFKE